MDAAIRAALPGCAIVADVERVLRPDLAAVRRLAGTSGPIVVGGWSAGVQGPRQLMVDGADVAGVVALDGTAANIPPAAWQIDVWRELAADARAGRRLFVATATQQTYTSALRDDPRTPQVEAPFMATVHVLKRALGQDLPPGTEVHEGGLHVYSVPSARIDAEAHREQLRVWLPRVLREHVAPWLASRATTASPIVDRDLKPENVAQAPGSATTGTPATTTATPRMLRLGLEGDDVRGWQRTLAILGYEVECTSVFDAVTDRVTRAFQGAAGVGVDGKVGPKTRAAADRALARRAAIGDPNIEPPPSTRPGPPPVRSAPPGIRPLTTADRERLFGRFDYRAREDGSLQVLGDWVQHELTQVQIPQLVGVEGAPQRWGVVVHRRLAAQLRDVFAAWETAGLLPLVRSWAGSWVPRVIRGTRPEERRLSAHAFGAAFDINAAWLPRGKHCPPEGVEGSVAALAPIALEHGWYWGEYFSVPDPMHFEAYRVDG
jgi:hypothetical protein